MEGYPLFELIDDLKVPLRIIYGQWDYISPSFAPYILSKVSNADYLVINRADHHMYWTHPEEFNMAVVTLK